MRVCLNQYIGDEAVEAYEKHIAKQKAQKDIQKINKDTIDSVKNLNVTNELPSTNENQNKKTFLNYFPMPNVNNNNNNSNKNNENNNVSLGINYNKNKNENKNILNNDKNNDNSTDELMEGSSMQVLKQYMPFNESTHRSKQKEKEYDLEWFQELGIDDPKQQVLCFFL